MITPSRFIRLTAAVTVLSAFTLYAQEKAAAEADKTAEAPAAVEADANDAARMKAEAAIDAEKREKTADDYYTMARNDFIEGSFRTSSEHALKAIEVLRDGKSAGEDSLQPPEVQEKIASAKALLSKAYYNLALEMFVDAEKSMNANLFDEAIAKCNEAVAVDPDNEEIKGYSEALIKKFNRLKEATEYNEETSYYSVDQQAPERQLTIEREMRKGQQFYKTGQWAKARDHFQAVLLEDPYNEMAIDYLRRCFLHLIDAGRRRHDVVTLERDADVAWKSVNSIVSPSNIDDQENGVDFGTKTDDTKNIEGKLKNIIIPNLDFEDQTLQEVIDILRRRSKELDPDKNGVNILLFLSNKPAKDGEAGEEGEDGESSSSDEEEEDAEESDEGESSSDDEESEEGDEESEEGGEEDGESGDDASAGGRTKYMIDYLKVDNVDLRQAIELVCEAAGVRYRVEPHAVLIADDGVPLDECELRVFVVEKDALDLLGGEGGEESGSSSSSSSDEEGGSQQSSSAIRRFFETRGVPFPANAAIKYDEAVSRLIVSNTPAALEMISDILEQLSNEQTNQVLVQVKFVEVQLNDLEELGFEYVISRPTNGETDIREQAIPLTPVVGPDNQPGPIPNPYGDGRPYTLVYYPPYTAGNGTSVLNGVTVRDTNGTYELNDTYQVPRDAQVTLPFTQDVPSYYALPLNLTSIYGSSVTWGPNSQLVRNAAQDTGAFTDSMTIDNDTVMSWANQDPNSGLNWSAKVHALDLADSSDILSAPRVTTLANEDAVIKMVTERYYPDEWDDPTLEIISSNSGRDIPVFQPSIPTFGDPVEEGIVLNVRPQVEENFTITLVMTPVIQMFVGWTDYSYEMPLEANGMTRYYPNTLKKPIIEARTVETTVVSYDGETIVLGGVIRDRVSMVDDQYPILGDIPLVGRLFQSKGRGSDKTSLLIFMTSRLIKPDGSPIRENEERGMPSFPY